MTNKRKIERLAGVTYQETGTQGVWVSKGGSVAFSTVGGGLLVVVPETNGYFGSLADLVWTGNPTGRKLEPGANRGQEVKLPNGETTTVGELIDQVNWDNQTKEEN